MKRKSTACQLFAFANLCNTVANIGASYIGAQHSAELERLKAENLALRNRNEVLKNGQEHNKVMKGDLEIELLNLRIQEKKWSNRSKGIGSAEFKVQNYAEPGDLRNGVMPPAGDNPVNF